jgi:hypothetical protein
MVKRIRTKNYRLSNMNLWNYYEKKNPIHMTTGIRTLFQITWVSSIQTVPSICCLQLQEKICYVRCFWPLSVHHLVLYFPKQHFYAHKISFFYIKAYGALMVKSCLEMKILVTNQKLLYNHMMHITTEYFKNWELIN